MLELHLSKLLSCGLLNHLHTLLDGCKRSLLEEKQDNAVHLQYVVKDCNERAVDLSEEHAEELAVLRTLLWQAGL